jgi:hypothetical protein
MQMFPTEAHKRKLLALLKVLGIKEVRADFAGGGDSGEFHVPLAYDYSGNKVSIDQHKLTWRAESSTWDERKGFSDNISDTTEQSLEEILHTLMEHIVGQTDLDWYNNEGGSGVAVINFGVSPPSVTVEMSINYMSTQDHNFDFSDDLLLTDDEPT